MQQQTCVVEAALLHTLDTCQSAETQAGMDRRRRIVGEMNTLVKQWIRTDGVHQGMDWREVEKLKGLEGRQLQVGVGGERLRP